MVKVFYSYSFFIYFFFQERIVETDMQYPKKSKKSLKDKLSLQQSQRKTPKKSKVSSVGSHLVAGNGTGLNRVLVYFFVFLCAASRA